MTAHRRRFLQTAAAAGLAAFAGLRPLRAADAEIEVDPSQPGPPINPHIYGHFIEHLGGVIYDGIWVGRDSKIPNVGGIRKQFVDDMKRIGAPNLRWPGRLLRRRLPLARRHRRRRRAAAHLQLLGAPHARGAARDGEQRSSASTSSCACAGSSGAEPYLAANVGSGTPQEFHDWVSYCNAPAGTLSLADERAANGDKEPFDVKYWGVGNESWGCGGNMTRRRIRHRIPQVHRAGPRRTLRPFFVATGPRGHSADGDVGWTEGFFAGLQNVRGLGVRVDGFALHYYTDFRQTAEDGAKFDAKGWYAVLHKGAHIEKVITDHWGIMGKYDPAAPHEVRDRRMGQLVPRRHRARPRLHPQPDDHAA